MSISSFLLPIAFILAFQSCQSQPQEYEDPNLSGEWFCELQSNDIGIVNTLLKFEAVDSTFSAHTRKDADKAILDFWKSTLARIFTNDFKNGSLLRITDGKVSRKQDTTVLAGIFRSAIGTYYFNGSVARDTLRAILRNGEKKQMGTLKGYRDGTRKYPLNDYPRIISEALDTAKSKIFNQKITRSKSWQNFETELSDCSSDLQDDVDLVFAFFYYADKLPISHFALTKIPTSTEHLDDSIDAFVTLEELNPKTALLQISSFAGSASEIDSVFHLILARDYRNLIVDLRDNYGGSVEAGMAFAKKVINEPMLGGIFLTQHWFNSHDSLPTISEYPRFPYFTESNFDLIIAGIHREAGLVLKVIPSEQNYKQNLYIITNQNTASTCEPLVYTLKKNGRATVVGTTTAGAMLNGEQCLLESGFSVFVPTADYYASDGFRIDQVGVTPNFEIKNQNPVDYIVTELIK